MAANQHTSVDSEPAHRYLRGDMGDPRRDIGRDTPPSQLPADLGVQIERAVDAIRPAIDSHQHALLAAIETTGRELPTVYQNLLNKRAMNYYWFGISDRARPGLVAPEPVQGATTAPAPHRRPHGKRSEPSPPHFWRMGLPLPQRSAEARPGSPKRRGERPHPRRPLRLPGGGDRRPGHPGRAGVDDPPAPSGASRPPRPGSHRCRPRRRPGGLRPATEAALLHQRRGRLDVGSHRC